MYEYRTIGQMDAALEAAEQDVVDDHGREAWEGCWVDIVRDLTALATPDVRAAVRRSWGIA